MIKRWPGCSVKRFSAVPIWQTLKSTDSEEMDAPTSSKSSGPRAMFALAKISGITVSVSSALILDTEPRDRAPVTFSTITGRGAMFALISMLLSTISSSAISNTIDVKPSATSSSTVSVRVASMVRVSSPFRVCVTRSFIVAATLITDAVPIAAVTRSVITSPTSIVRSSPEMSNPEKSNFEMSNAIKHPSL